MPVKLLENLVVFQIKIDTYEIHTYESNCGQFAGIEESYPISPIAQIINRWTSAERETTFPFDGLVLFVQQSTRFSLLPNPP